MTQLFTGKYTYNRSTYHSAWQSLISATDIQQYFLLINVLGMINKKCLLTLYRQGIVIKLTMWNSYTLPQPTEKYQGVKNISKNYLIQNGMLLTDQTISV